MSDVNGRLRRASAEPTAPPDIRVRARAFALRIIRLYAALPKTTEAQVMGKQILRSGTSVGAHVAESNRAKSRADFTCKIDGAMQELDETTYWVELLVESGIVEAPKVRPLISESAELMAIFTTMVKKTRER